MSDKDDKSIEQIGEEGENADALTQQAQDPEPEPAVPSKEEAVSTPPPVAAPPQSKGSSAIAWLALLLVLALACGAGWYYLEVQKRETVLLDRLAALESASTPAPTAASEPRDISGDLDKLSAEWEQQLREGLSELREMHSGHATALNAFEEKLAEQSAEMARYSANDRDSWLMAEAEYLLRLANQRLIMAGDTVAAQALLKSADNILQQLDDVSLYAVRSAVAADIAAIRAVPKVDVEGIYLRLSALLEQADQLVIFELPELPSREQASDNLGWQERLRQGYEEALAKLSDYIIIRRRDVPMQALMDPQWEGLVRQNLRMLLEQSQVSLLSGNQTLYQESLQRARYWVAEFFESDEAAARAMDNEIAALADEQVAVSMPDISRSLRALDSSIERRMEQGGDE